MKKAVILVLLFFLLLPASRVCGSTEDVPAALSVRVVRTAGELAEIQAQAQLFVETGGRKGSLEPLSGDYILAADIDLTGEWTPIGDSDANPRFVFCGSFDGAGFTIRGLEISDSRRGVTRGLFGKVEGAEIRNLVLENAAINASGDYGRKEFSAGFLAGEAFGGTIENIRIRGGEIFAGAPDSGNGAVGGLIGKASGTEIRNVYVSNVRIATNSNRLPAQTLRVMTGQVINDEAADVPLRAAGGIAGHLEDCEVHNAAVLNANINANALSAGGMAGQIRGGRFSACNAEFVTLSGAETSGGFVGLVQENAVFEDCRAAAILLHRKLHPASRGCVSTHDVPAALPSAHAAGGIKGGFAGRVTGAEVAANIGAEFTRCHAFSYVEAPEANALIGGFAGRLAGRSRISRSHANGNIIAREGFAGGFVGEITNASRIEFSSASGAVFGGSAAGGFAAIVASVGAPNTITESVALTSVVAGNSRNSTRRFAARLEHDGINGGYAYLGMAVITNGKLSHVTPNPFGNDGGDFFKIKFSGALPGLHGRAANAPMQPGQRPRELNVQRSKELISSPSTPYNNPP